MIVKQQKDGSWSAFQRICGQSFVAEGQTRLDAIDSLLLLVREHGITNITAQVGSDEHE
jgi:hypothetical protein